MKVINEQPHVDLLSGNPRFTSCFFAECAALTFGLRICVLAFGS